MRSLLFLLAVVLAMTSCTSSTTYYLVRHAEKGSGSDPSLTEQGVKRANALRDSLKNKGINYIYVTNYLRTQETAAPTASQIGKKSKVLNGKDTPALVRQLRKHKRGNILVVGHSNTIPVVIDSLMKRPQNIVLGEKDYNDLFVVEIEKGKSQLRRKKYGEN